MISKGIKSLTEFTSHVQEIEQDFWGNRFRQYAKWKDRWWEEYQKKGYIDLPTGFRCQELMSKKQACNYPGQGSAFHCLLWSFIEADRIMLDERWDTKIVGQIHDSILLDVLPSELNHVVKTLHRVTCKDLPEAWKWIVVPLEIDMELCEVDKPWSSKDKFNFKTLS
jgi:DNA polymerase I-like protein with 3'-5' exonuclease and polymerase domains